MDNKLTYQGRPTEITRSLSDDILVGWYPAKESHDVDFVSMSRNMAEFLACELHDIGFKNQIYSDSIIEILNSAHQQDRKFCLLHQVGWWGGGIYQMLSDILKTQYTQEAVMGLSSSGDLSGISLINIQWWVDAGKPDPASDQFIKLALEHRAGPWPVSGLRRARISNLHPDAGLDHHTCMSDELDTDIFFCANTEDFSLYTAKDQTNITDTIITIAGGLSAILMSYSEQMPAGSRIVVVDNSPRAITMSQRIFQEWNGENYAEFIERLIAQGVINPQKLRGRHKLHIVDDILARIPGFVEWFNNTFKTYRIQYRTVDLLDTLQVQQLLEDVIAKSDQPVTGVTRKVFINFSNVYQYMPTAVHVGYDQRRLVAVEVAKLITATCKIASVVPKIKASGIMNFDNTLKIFPWR